MEDKYTIRKMRVTDAAALAKWFNKFVDQDVGVVENFHVNSKQEESYIKDMLAKEKTGEASCRLILLNGRIVGKADLLPLKRYIDKHVAEISFGILMGESEMGITLLAELEKIAIKEGLEQIIYFILSNNEYFIKIFSSLGYKEVGRIKNFYKKESSYFDRVILQKEL